MQENKLTLKKIYGSGEDDNEWRLNFVSEAGIEIYLSDFYPFKIKYDDLITGCTYSVDYALYFRLFKNEKSIVLTDIDRETYKLKYLGNSIFAYKDLNFKKSRMGVDNITDDGFHIMKGEEYYTSYFFSGMLYSIQKVNEI